MNVSSTTVTGQTPGADVPSNNPTEVTPQTAPVDRDSGDVISYRSYYHKQYMNYLKN